MAQADEDRKQKKLRKRKLPAGTSEYQVCTRFYSDSHFFLLAKYLVWKYMYLIFFIYFQAAWIVDDSDEEQSDCDNEDEDGMMLDEVNGFPGQEGNKYADPDGDGASLRLGDSDDETDNDSVMMVSLLILLQY